ncbi:MAG: hypothetical protein WBE28_11415 [bacterium]
MRTLHTASESCKLMVNLEKVRGAAQFACKNQCAERQLGQPTIHRAVESYKLKALSKRCAEPMPIERQIEVCSDPPLVVAQFIGQTNCPNSTKHT